MHNSKMQISITSDRHHEFEWDYASRDTLPENADIYILAGDIDTGTNAIPWAASLGERVLYVPGNHEFYHGNIEKVNYALRKKASRYPNLHLLQNECVHIGGIRFLGATLWTDYAIYKNPNVAMSWADSYLADHRLITTGMDRSCHFFSAANARKRHYRDRAWLERELKRPWNGKTVVVTHHAPHAFSVHKRFRGDPLTPAFVSDLSDILSSHAIDLWLHGHMHDPVDYTVFDTRVVCNPRGYQGTTEINNYNPGLIIEV